MAEKKQIGLETEKPENLPDLLLGDAARLKEVTVSVLANAINHSEAGHIRLSVFGKIRNETVHLLFSIQALPEEENSSADLSGRKAVQADHDLDLEVAGALLASMGSELKLVRSGDAWKNIYFEMDQQIANPEQTGIAASEEQKR